MSDDRVYLGHILEAIRRIRVYTQDGRASFLASTMSQDAVIRQLEIMGEATKNLSRELRQAHPEIEWRSMAALRDVLIHDYMGIELAAIWKVVENEVPIVLRDITRLMEALDSGD